MTKKRDASYASLDEAYGANNWKFTWKFGNRLIEWREALEYYEDAYYVFLLKFDRLLERVCEYRECYDNAVSNVASGFDYTKQENDSNHYQDISVRRCLRRLGRGFEDKNGKLLHIRQNSKDDIGRILSPGNVPFLLEHVVELPVMKGWWKSGTIEEFWQSNRFLVIKNGCEVER